MRALACGLVVLGAWALAASAVRADAIEMPPACPPGARGRSSHAGLWCEPAPCEAGCARDEHCEERRVCTQPTVVTQTGRHPTPTPPPPVTMEVVVATCDASRECTGMEEPPPPTIGALVAAPPTCRSMQVCVPAALPALPGFTPRPSASAVPPTSAPSTAPASTAAASTAAASTAAEHRSCACAVPSRRGGSALAALVALAWLSAVARGSRARSARAAARRGRRRDGRGSCSLR